MGDWKLSQQRGKPELYTLRTDIGESIGLITKEPLKAVELQSAYDAWSKEMQDPKWVRQSSRNSIKPNPDTPVKSSSTTTPKVSAGRRLQQLFQNSDKDEDGKLSFEEFPQQDIFKDVDKDNDGLVTDAEVRSYYLSRRDQPSGEKP